MKFMWAKKAQVAEGLRELSTKELEAVSGGRARAIPEKKQQNPGR